jgi:hypothetical protein
VSEAVRLVARLTLLRIGRGRTRFVSLALALLPILMAAIFLRRGVDEPFRRVVEMTLRFVATLVTVLHLAPAVAEEIDARTWTYLWSRPFPRPALLLGKVLAVAPAVIALSTLSLGAGYAIVYQAEAGAHLGELLRGLGGCFAATLGSAAFAIAIGTLMPRFPLVFALGWFAAEQVLFLIPNVAKLSPLYHARFLAGQPPLRSEPESLLAAGVWLTTLTAGLLLVAVWRVAKAEYARADA